MAQKDNIKLLDTKFIKVGNEKYPIRLTYRAMIEYEKLSGKSVSTVTTTEQVTELIYCAVKAGAKAEGKEFNKTYEEFLDVIDNYPDSMVSFYEALTDGEPTPKKEQPKVN